MNDSAIDATHDPALRSWVPGADEHDDFPVQNLPFGIFAPPGGHARIGVAIGDHILDLGVTRADLPEATGDALRSDTLNALLALPAATRRDIRRHLSRQLTDERRRGALEPLLHPAAACALHLPARIGDYTDFYTGIHHATNIGRVLRPDNPLLPNYKYVPIGYHGRASSIRVSGQDVRRPAGQRKPADADTPELGPSLRLDYEAELGFWIGEGNALGTRIPIEEAGERIAGVSLLNDWSARDLQAWEYQPLGPFLAKNFQTTISPWVVTAEALAPFRRAQPPRPAGDPRPLPYLWNDADQAGGALALTIEVWLASQAMRAEGVEPFRLSAAEASDMYWTPAQLVAHHTIGGCDLNPADLLGSGTISASTPDGYGSLMEISEGGRRPLTLPGGETRTFLEDGDEVRLRGRAHAAGFRSIGFGNCVGRIVA